MEEAAAALMGNSPAAWSSSYDDGRHVRDMRRIIAAYPKYKKWVRSNAKLARRLVPRDPHEALFV